MTTFITIAQLVVAILIIVLILLQQRDNDLSNFLGGGSGGSGFYQQRRGLERVFFIATIICIIVFAGLALLRLLYRPTTPAQEIPIASEPAGISIVAPTSTTPRQ